MAFEVLQVTSELDRMRRLYLDTAPKRVLEIGTWQGGTLREWLVNATRDAKVVAVDLDHPNQIEYEGWRRPDTDLVVVHGNSLNRAIIDRVVAEGPFDWVFIDGDHGEHSVRTDLNTALACVDIAGRILFHDIAPPDNDPLWPHSWYPPGVVVDSLAADGWQVDRFVDPAPSPVAHGIGVVTV